MLILILVCLTSRKALSPTNASLTIYIVTRTMIAYKHLIGARVKVTREFYVYCEGYLVTYLDGRHVKIRFRFKGIHALSPFKVFSDFCCSLSL